MFHKTKKAYVNFDEVYITIKKVGSHYEFYEGSAFIESCDNNELDETKKKLTNEYLIKFNKVVNYVCK